MNAHPDLLLASQQKMYNCCDSHSNSSDELIEITELHKSISNVSFEESFMLVNSQRSSKANFLLNAPSTSSVSLYVNEENIVELPISEDIPNDDKNSNCQDLDALNIGFTRIQMKKRLDNLVKRAMKYFKGDAEDLVPATKYGKYALRYRVD